MTLATTSRTHGDMAPRPALPADQLVTASDLVRHFGVWQERAARAPLYILHRGRPRLVLTSIETMDALCAAHALPATHAPAYAPAAEIDAGQLLDAIGDLVLVVDAHGAILASSRPARAHFGALARQGAPVEAIVPSSLRATFAATIRQVIDWGVAAQLKTASAAREGRSLLLTLEPAGCGVAVIASDTESERPTRDLQEADRARLAALDAAGVASVLLGLDGGFVESTAPLDAMLGLDPTTLQDARLGALLDDAARAAFDAAFGQVALGGPAAVLEGGLPSALGAPRRVRIALAPMRREGRVIGVAAVVLIPSQITDVV